MIVTVIAVRMMQAAAGEVVHMISMRHRFVSASRTVHMSRRVPHRRWSAAGRIARGDLDEALVDMVSVHRVQAAIVQIVDMVPVEDGGVPASLAVDVRVLGMDPVLRHGQTLLHTRNGGRWLQLI